MLKRLRYILSILLLLAATQAAGQYIIDKVCVGSVRYYRVDGEAGSTYIWTLTDPSGTPVTLPSTADTVAITWSGVTGVYHLSTIQHSVVTGCDGVLELGEIEVYPQPAAFAGNPLTFCTPAPYQLLDATASDYSSLLWTTSGDGTFDDDTILHPVYSPGVNDLATGTVTLTLTAFGLGNGNACTPAVSTITIHQSTFVVGVTATATNVSCFGGNDGTATAHPTGGTGVYTYLWNDPASQTTATATGLYIGTYTVIVWDENNCSDTASVTVTQPAIALSVTAVSTPVSCKGGNDGTATATAAGGTVPYTYLWSDGQTTNPAINLTAGTYTVIATDANLCTATTTVVVTEPAVGLSVVIASQVNATCYGYSDGSATAAASGGTPPYTYSWNTVPVQTTVTAINLAAGTYTITVTDNNNCTATAQATITEPPQIVASAGPDDLICETGTYWLTGAVATNYSSLAWTTSGNGTFNDATLLQPVYTPGPADIAAGSVTLTLTAHGIPPCHDTTDAMVLSISRQAVVYAGRDTTICQTSDSVHLVSATASYYTSLLWTTSGTGTFSNATITNPVYYPSLADITAGGVTLTLTGNSVAPCITVSDQMNLNITRQADAYAGADALICETQGTWSLTAATANFYVSILWTTTGSGTFNDATIVNPVYTPSFADITAGSVTLTLTAYGIVPCADSSSSMTLTISRQATAFAGPDDSVCANLPVYTLSSAVATLYTSISWATSGTGSFNDLTIQNPVYTPSAPDIAAGVVTLTLSATSAAPCVTAVDAMVLHIIPQVVASAGNDTSGCQNTPILIAGSSAFNYSTITWTHNGTGTLFNANAVHPTYNPGINETGVVTLTMTVQSIAPCTETIVDQMNITIYPLPGGTLSGSDVLCEGDSTVLTLTFYGTPPITVTFTNGVDTTTVSNIMTSPAYITITPPPGNWVYTLVSLTDAHCSAPPNQLLGSAIITVNPKPDLDFTWTFGDQNYEIVFSIDWSVTDWGAVGNMILWNFDDGTFGYDSIEYHLFPAPNTYNVTLSVTDTLGCTNSITHQVVVPDRPRAFFDSSEPTCLGQPTCFTDLSTVSDSTLEWIVTWVWNYGDGSPLDTIHFPNNPDHCHTYAALGTYPVTLTVIDNYGYVTSYTADVRVIPTPIVSFMNSVGCQNMDVQFTDLSSENGGDSITWQWNFGDPGSGIHNTSNIQNPVHTYANAGTYMVTLIVSNFNSCSDTLVKPVLVRPAPPVEFTHDTACLNSVMTFTGDLTVIQVDSVASWDWDFGDGTPHSVVPLTVQHNYTSTGIYYVTLTITDLNGCENSVTHSLIVHDTPIANFYANMPVCAGTPVQFTDESLMPVGSTGFINTWRYDFGDGTFQVINLPSSPNVSHTYTGTGTSYLVRLTVWTNSGCSSFIEKMVNLSPAPIADFSVSQVTCEDQAVAFTDLSQGNGGLNLSQWNWNFGDPGSGSFNVSTLQNPTHTYAAAGTYTVTLVVSNLDNCTDTVTRQVIIHIPPQPDFTATTSCQGTPTQFTDASVPNATNMINYAWNFGDGSPISNQQNPSHTYSTAGNFQVTLTVTNSNGCIQDTTKQVTVNPLPTAAFYFTTPNCLNQPVDFTDQSTVPPGYLGGIARWTWDFGDGTIVNITAPGNPNVSHAYAGPGTTYTVRLTVKTSDSCESYVEHVLNFTHGPIAAFSSSSNNCALQPIQFTDLSQPNGGSGITTWNWNFGDPLSGTQNTSTLQNPVHNFSGAGTYTVTLIAGNENGCTDTATSTVIISVQPVAAFTADTVCTGTPTTFTDLSSSPVGQIVGYFWEFGDGGTSQAQNPTHLYAMAQTYNVKLTVTNEMGCTKDTIRQVAVSSGATAAFSVSTVRCASNPVTFTDQSTTPTGYIMQWTWNFGDGTTTTINFPASPNVTHIYAAGGPYTVTLSIVTSATCAASHSVNININPAPIANYIYSNTLCEGMSVQFTDQSMQNGGGLIASRQWNFDDPGSGSQNFSTQTNPTHVFSAAGSYDVLLIVTNAGGCVDSVMKTVVINEAPVAMFSSDAPCFGLPTQFTDGSTAANGAIVSWLWNFGDPASGPFNTSTLQNPLHTFTSVSTFSVHLTVTDSYGCTHDTIMQVTVKPAPDALFQYDISCAGTATQFTDISTSSGSIIVSWFWNFGDGIGTSTIQNPSYTYVTSGTYNVKLIVTNLAGCTDSIIMPVESRPTPVAAYYYTSFFCPQGKVNFQDQSTAFGATIVDRFWIFEPGQTGSGPNPTHTFSGTDTVYAVTLIVTDNFGCKDTIVDSIFVKPAFAFTAKSDTACFGLPTHFEAINLAEGDTLYNVAWNFGDYASGQNNYSNLYKPTHIYSEAGAFVTLLKVTNSDNCVDSAYINVTVYHTPVPEFTYLSEPCNSTVQFMDQSIPGVGSIDKWEWNFGDGTPPVIINAPGPADISHVYSSFGQFNVMMIVTNSRGCIDTVTKVVEVPTCINASFTQSAMFLCSNSPVTFTDNSQPVDMITTWHWTFGDGEDTTYASFAANINHEYSFAGNYQVWLVITSVVNGTTYTDSTFVNVGVRPGPQAAFESPSVCLNQVSNFTDQSGDSGVPITSWSWNFGEPSSGSGNQSTEPDTHHKYATTGTFNVKLVVINKVGCADSIIKPVRVHGLPVAGFEYNLVCEGNPTTFFDMSTPADTMITSWNWDFGTSATIFDKSSEQDPVYIYPNEGNYPVQLIVHDYFNCPDTVDSTITVHPTPVSAFRVMENIDGRNGKIQLLNQTTGASQYYWIFGNGQTSELENPVTQFTEDGTYTIELISYSDLGCTDTTWYEYDMLFKGLYIPNAFAPTSGNPEVSMFQPVGIGLKSYHIWLFNNYSQLLWESTAIDADGRPIEGWDGTFRGKLMPQDTYFWKVEATFIDGTIWEGNVIHKDQQVKPMGSVSLIR